jgi:dipeptidyl aminopeptidase/acylaminoacyl peptidase
MVGSGYREKRPYVAPQFDEAQIAFLGEMGQKSYDQLLVRLAALRGVEISRISYVSDGLKVTGLEVLPTTFAAGEKGPLILYNRGGSRDYGSLSVPQILSLMAPMALRLGAGVLASNYRGNGGGEGREEFGGADVRDVLRLIEIGKQQPWWDGKHVFMLGWSRGGMMTYLALKAGAPVNAAAVGAGITDLFEGALARPTMEENVFKKLIPDYATAREDALAARSAVRWPEKLTVPLLLLHGDSDRKVNISHARDLHAALVALGKDTKLVEFQGGGHGLMSENAAVIDEVVGWFNAHR